MTGPGQPAATFTSGPSGAWGDLGRRTEHEAQLLDEVVGVENRVGAVSDQQVAALRRLPAHVTGHGEHRDAVGQGVSGGDEGASGDAGLDHHHRRRQPADDPVAQRESPRLRSSTGRVLGHHGSPGLYQPVAQRPMLRRVVDVGAAPEHGDTGSPGGHRAGVSGPVDAAGEPGHQHPAGAGDRLSVLGGELAPVGGAPAGPHHRHRRARGEPATDEQDVGRVGSAGEGVWVPGISPEAHLDAARSSSWRRVAASTPAAARTPAAAPSGCDSSQAQGPPRAVLGQQPAQLLRVQAGEGQAEAVVVGEVVPGTHSAPRNRSASPAWLEVTTSDSARSATVTATRRARSHPRADRLSSATAPLQSGHRLGLPLHGVERLPVEVAVQRSPCRLALACRHHAAQHFDARLTRWAGQVVGVQPPQVQPQVDAIEQRAREAAPVAVPGGLRCSRNP